MYTLKVFVWQGMVRSVLCVCICVCVCLCVCVIFGSVCVGVEVFQFSSSISVTRCTRWWLFIDTLCLAIILFCTMWIDEYLYVGVLRVDCSWSGLCVIWEGVYVLYCIHLWHKSNFYFTTLPVLTGRVSFNFVHLKSFIFHFIWYSII